MIDVNKVHRMDAVEGLKKIPDGSVDLVITDPPYNIADASKLTVRKGKVITTMEAWGAWDSLHPFDYEVLMMQLLSQCYRVLKPGGAMYLFTAREQNAFFIRKAVERGFTYRNVIAMVKRNPLPSFFKNCWRSGFDLCMYLTKGKTRTFNFTSQQDLNSVYPYGSNFKSTDHPTEKPIGLIRRYVAISSNPGDLVLDPFMGSGTTAVAAKQLGRRYLGFDTNADYIEMAEKRIGREGADSAATGGKLNGC
jgi:site-specific DNA-methyltransferase (adenine-specific)